VTSRVRWLLLLAGLAIFGFFLWQLDLDGARDALRDADPWALIAVLALNAAIIGLFGVRSHLVLRRLGHQLPLSLVTPIALVGNVAGALTPASAGEVLRLGALRAHAEVPARDGFTLIVFERGVSLYLLIIGGLAGAAWLSLPAAAATVVSALLLVALAMPLAAPLILRRMSRPVDAPSGNVWDALRDAAGRLSLLLSDAGLLVRWSLLTYGVFAVTTLQYWLLARSLSGEITINEAWVALAFSQLAAIVSLIPLGLGVADSSLAKLLERFGMTLEQGAVVALLVRTVCTAPLIIAAFVCYAWLVRNAPVDAERSGPQPSRSS
jgi:uncharacterized protein (TIRG00374 family)